MDITFQTLADHLPDKLWMCSPEGHAFFFNKRWSEYTGVFSEDMKHNINAGWSTLHPDDLPGAQAQWAASIRQTLPFETQYRMKDRQGVYRWHIVRGRPVIEDGKVTMWIGTSVDNDDFVVQNTILAALSSSDENLDTLLCMVETLKSLATEAVTFFPLELQ